MNLINLWFKNHKHRPPKGWVFDRTQKPQSAPVAHTCKCLGLIRRYGPKVTEVALVPNQHDDDVAVCVVLQLLQPALSIFVRQVLGDVIDQKSSDSTAVVST